MSRSPTTKPDLAADFRRVDRTSDPHFFIRFLDATRTQALKLAKADPRAFFSFLDAKEGHHLLDVGCGTGDFDLILAELVGPRGRVVGVDASEAMVAEARRRAAGSNSPVEFGTGDAHNLDLSSNTFDRSMATALFQHLDDPERALAELVRVTQPGGWIFVSDHDWESHVVDARDRESTRKILNFFSDNIPKGWIAHHLPAMFKQAGLQEVTVTGQFVSVDFAIAEEFWLAALVERAIAADVVTEDQGQTWFGELRDRARQGVFFEGFTMLRVSGRKR